MTDGADAVGGAAILLLGIVLVSVSSADVAAAYFGGAVVSHGLTRYVDWLQWSGQGVPDDE